MDTSQAAPSSTEPPESLQDNIQPATNVSLMDAIITDGTGEHLSDHNNKVLIIGAGTLGSSRQSNPPVRIPFIQTICAEASYRLYRTHPRSRTPESA